jgi:hypothetical protein
MRDSLKTYIKDLEATTKAKERLESELQIARRIQVDMLPAANAGGRPGDGFELRSEPARQIGGDVQYFLLTASSRSSWATYREGSGRCLHGAPDHVPRHRPARPDLAEVPAP